MNEFLFNLILDAREERFNKQQYLIKKYNCPIITFTINTPGVNKNSEIVKDIFKIGNGKITKSMNLNKIDLLYSETSSLKASGPESYFVINSCATKTKKLMIALELSSPLGRLFDIDVMDTNLNIISRKDLGYKRRKCFICDNEAKICARSKSHSLEQTINKFNQIYYDYIGTKLITK